MNYLLSTFASAFWRDVFCHCPHNCMGMRSIAALDSLIQYACLPGAADLSALYYRGGVLSSEGPLIEVSL